MKELPPRHIVNLFAQIALCHSFHVEVFVANEVVFHDELLGFFVVQLKSLPRRLTVQLCHTRFGLLAPVAVLLGLARQGTLRHPELLAAGLKEPVVLAKIAVLR